MTFDPAWEAEHKKRRWGAVPNEHLVRFVSRHFAECVGCRFLDIGAGAGAQTMFLAQFGIVTALDASSSALQRIEMLSRDTCFAPKISFHQADIATATYQRQSLDCIVDVASLQCLSLDQADDFVQRARLWLKPNGCFFSYTDAGSDKSLHTIGTVYPRTHAQVRKMFRGYSFAIGNEVVDRPDGPSTRHLIIEARVQS